MRRPAAVQQQVAGQARNGARPRRPRRRSWRRRFRPRRGHRSRARASPSRYSRASRLIARQGESSQVVSLDQTADLTRGSQPGGAPARAVSGRHADGNASRRHIHTSGLRRSRRPPLATTCVDHRRGVPDRPAAGERRPVGLGHAGPAVTRAATTPSASLVRGLPAGAPGPGACPCAGRARPGPAPMTGSLAPGNAGEHGVRMDLQAREQLLRERQRGPGQQARLGERWPFGLPAPPVTLVLGHHALQQHLGVRPGQPGQGDQMLGGFRIPLVRHGDAAHRPGRQSLGQLPDLGPLELVDLRPDPRQGRGDHREQQPNSASRSRQLVQETTGSPSPRHCRTSTQLESLRAEEAETAHRAAELTDEPARSPSRRRSR